MKSTPTPPATQAWPAPASAPADECVYLYTIAGAPSARLYINKEEAERAARILFPEEDPHHRYARIYFREYHKRA